MVGQPELQWVALTLTQIAPRCHLFACVICLLGAVRPSWKVKQGSGDGDCGHQLRRDCYIRSIVASRYRSAGGKDKDLRHSLVQQLDQPRPETHGHACNDALAHPYGRNITPSTTGCHIDTAQSPRALLTTDDICLAVV